MDLNIQFIRRVLYPVEAFGCGRSTNPGGIYAALSGAVYKNRNTSQSESTNQELQQNLSQ